MEYTADQNRAIETIDDNLQIIACAGSGKTEVISARIVHILKSKKDEGVTPGNIVAFAYNKKAAAELKDRIHRMCKQELGTDQGLGDMFIGTIHGYCLSLLQEPPLYDYLKYQVLSEVHQRLFMDRFSNQSGLCNTPLLRGGTLERWKNSKLYQQLIGVCAESDIDRGRIPDGVKQCLQSYQDLLDKHNYLDYTTIMTKALEALRSHQPLRAKLSSQIRYLIVDEYQDINPLQEQLIYELYDLCGNICVVGDDDQTIYQWRGSDVNNIIGFTDRYPDAATIPLNENFRSSKGIVEAARQFIERVPDRLTKAMQSAGAQSFERGDILALGFADPQEEARWIVERIRQLHGLAYQDKADSEPRGLTYADMAILLRTVRKDARVIIEELERAGIPYIVGGIDGLFDTREIQTICTVFHYLSDYAPHRRKPLKERTVRDALANAGLGLTAEQIDNGIMFLNERKARITDEKDAELYLQRLYLDFLAAIDLREERINEESPGSGEIIYYNLGKFSNVISDFEQINFHSTPERIYPDFSGFLHYQAPSYYPEGWEENGFARPDAVQIMTVHKAKGMQWPAVFVPCLRQNRFPSSRHGGRSIWHVIPTEAVANADRYRGTVDDERRLFFVAVTRAEKYLFCTWAPIADNQQQRKVSVFFRDFTNNEHVLTRDPGLAVAKRLDPQSRHEDVTLALTFSELKYYFMCPYLFKLRFLYGFDAPISRAMGYGKSLHDALAEIHAESINGRIPGLDQVEKLVDDHLNLPYANPAVEQNLRKAAWEALSQYLREHGQNLEKLEHVEKDIELKLGEGIVVNGRIDLIRRTDTNEFVIVDFKSDERAQAEDITQRQLHVYAVGFEQLTGTKADLIEVHNLDHGGAKREVIDDELTQETLETINAAGRGLRENVLPRKSGWCDDCARCDLKSICRSEE